MKNRGSWEDLRKEARSLESEIDIKLVKLSKLGNQIGSFPSSSKFGEKDPLLSEDASKSGSIFQSQIEDIEMALSRLSSVNDAMSAFAESSNTTSSALHHTLQRHREILIDYGQEFAKTRSNLMSVLEREDLLNSVHRDIDRFKQSGSSNSNKATNRGENRKMEILLRENEHARNSERLIDDQINIAIESRESLLNHRVVFKAMQTRVNDITNRFPVINNLVQKINLKKKRDSVILGTVIGSCIIFSVWYMFG